MKARLLTLLMVVAAFAIISGIAHADQAPNPPSCGSAGSDGVISVSQPYWNGGSHQTWHWDVTHNCNNGKTFMGEIQVCDIATGCTYQDVQGFHVFDQGSCTLSKCTRTQTLVVACSDPNGTKQWRAQAWDANSHVTSTVWRGGCPPQ